MILNLYNSHEYSVQNFHLIAYKQFPISLKMKG